MKSFIIGSPVAQAGLAAACGSIATLGCLRAYRRYWRRIPNADAVPANVLAKRRWINGIVTRYSCPSCHPRVSPSAYLASCLPACNLQNIHVLSVGDGDNFRLYHTPGLFWRWPLKLRRVPTIQKGKSSPMIGTRKLLIIAQLSELRDQTIHIRMAGVDAPEVSSPLAPPCNMWNHGPLEPSLAFSH